MQDPHKWTKASLVNVALLWTLERVVGTGGRWPSRKCHSTIMVGHPVAMAFCPHLVISYAFRFYVSFGFGRKEAPEGPDFEMLFHYYGYNQWK